jgi:CBS domain-containing protein
MRPCGVFPAGTMSGHGARHRESTPAQIAARVWLWRGASCVSLCLALLFTFLALVSSGWWGLPCVIFLVAAVACLQLSEPEDRDGRLVRRPSASPVPARSPRRQSVALGATFEPLASTESVPTVKDVMTPNPTALPATAPVSAAARAMRDLDIGAVVVVEDSRPLGILTDRDIVVRALARGRELTATTLGDICSRDLATVPSGTSREEALGVMAARAVRRLPVTLAGGVVVGIVSIDDLAVADDRGSVATLTEIHDAAPNR